MSFSLFSQLPKASQALIFGSTYNIWQNLPYDERLTAILEHFNIDEENEQELIDTFSALFGFDVSEYNESVAERYRELLRKGIISVQEYEQL